jgi:hypothetical protein
MLPTLLGSMKELLFEVSAVSYKLLRWKKYNVRLKGRLYSQKIKEGSKDKQELNPLVSRQSKNW